MPIENVYVNNYYYNNQPYKSLLLYSSSATNGVILTVKNIPSLYTVQIGSTSKHYQGHYCKIIHGPQELIGVSALLDMSVLEHSLQTGEFVAPGIWPLTISRCMMFKNKGTLKLCSV